MLAASLLTFALGQTLTQPPVQAPAANAPIWALQPERVIMPDGSSAEGVTVVIQDGKILNVGKDLVLPPKARQMSLEGVLAPGFVDAFSAYGFDGRAEEDSRSLTPALRAADAIDLRENDRWSDLRDAGVTSIHVMPEPSNVQAGWGAVVASGGDGERILAKKTRQVLSLAAQAVQDQDFGPSSQSGAVEVFEQSKSTKIKGIDKSGAIVHVASAEAIQAARAELGKIDCRWMLWGDPGSYGGELRGQSVGMQLPAGGTWSPRALETLKRLHKAGVKVNFGTWAWRSSRDPRELRRAAIVMSRVTGDPAAAMAAITSGAADFVGNDQVGAIAKGRRADLVLWSAHPLDSSARIQAVMIGGKTVSRGSAQEN